MNLPHGAVATYLSVITDHDTAWELESLDHAFSLYIPKAALPFLSLGDTLLTTLVMTRIQVGEPEAPADPSHD